MQSANSTTQTQVIINGEQVQLSNAGTYSSVKHSDIGTTTILVSVSTITTAEN